MSEQPSLNLTPARLGFALSLLAIITFGWNIAGYVQQQEYRIVALETYRDENKQLTRDMLAELKRLNEAVTRLGIIIEGSRAPDQKQASSTMQPPGVVVDFGRPLGTGAGGSAQESPNITFPEKAVVR